MQEGSEDVQSIGKKKREKEEGECNKYNLNLVLL